MGDGSGCMGLNLIFLVAPSPTLGDGADDRLAARVDMNVLDPHQLLALAAVPVESVGERRERAHQLVGVLQAQLAAGEVCSARAACLKHSSADVAAIRTASIPSTTSRRSM